MKALTKRAWLNFRQSLWLLILLEVLTLIFSQGILQPLCEWIFRFSVRISGVRVVTNSNYMRYLRFPFTWLFLLLILFLWIMASLFEIFSLILILEMGYTKTKTVFPAVVRMTLKKEREMLKVRNIPFVFYVLFVLGIGLDVLNTQLLSLAVMPGVFMLTIEKKEFYFWLFTAGKGLLILVGAFGLLTLHYVLLEGMRFPKAYGKSVSVIRKHFLTYLFCGIIWLILELVLENVVPKISTMGATALAELVSVRTPFGYSVLFLFDGIMLFIDEAVHLLILLFSYALIGAVYDLNLTKEKRSENRRQFLLEQNGYMERRLERKNRLRRRYGSMILNVLCLAALAFWVWKADFNSRLSYMILGSASGPVEITAHRGTDTAAPENTIPAFEYACANAADWLETDVHQLADGTLVLFHDNNFNRVAGLYQYVWEASWEDVSVMDVGSYLGEQWASVTICTLEQFLEFCRQWPQIKINLELKVDKVSGLDFVDRTVETVREYGMEERVVFASTSIPAIRRVKLLDSNLKTALVAKFVYGDVASLSFVDYLSISKESITWQICRDMHARNKEVWVWTLEEEGDVLPLVRMGADNLITTDIAMTKAELRAGRNPVGTEDSNLPMEYKADARNRYLMMFQKNLFRAVRRFGRKLSNLAAALFD